MYDIDPYLPAVSGGMDGNRLVVPVNRAFIQLIHTCKDLDQGGFACPIFPNQSMYLSLLDIHVYSL